MYGTPAKAGMSWYGSDKIVYLVHRHPRPIFTVTETSLSLTIIGHFLHPIERHACSLLIFSARSLVRDASELLHRK
jgi:hypothetical protein